MFKRERRERGGQITNIQERREEREREGIRDEER